MPRNYAKRRPRVTQPCLTCGRVMSVLAAEVRRGNGRYCSRACAVEGARRLPRLSRAERFWRHVDTDSDPRGCWLWRGHCNEFGYGLFSADGIAGSKILRAHRVAWELLRGAIPVGLELCHHCDNPPCVNPDHLFIGTRSDNMRDMVAKGRHRSNLPHQWGEAHSQARLSDEDVIEMRRRYSFGGVTQRQLALAYGVSDNHVSAILTRRLWRHLP